MVDQASRPLPPKTLSILVGLTSKLISLCNQIAINKVEIIWTVLFVFVNIFSCKPVKACFGRERAEMQDLVENVAEIAQISYYCGRSLASDEVGPEKTCVIANNLCRNRRESVPVSEK